MGLHRILVIVCPITHVHTRVLGIKGTEVEKVIGLGLVWYKWDSSVGRPYWL